MKLYIRIKNVENICVRWFVYNKIPSLFTHMNFFEKIESITILKNL